MKVFVIILTIIILLAVSYFAFINVFKLVKDIIQRKKDKEKNKSDE